MIEVSEHVYNDNPGQGPYDVRTRLKDVSYFFPGNGFIQAAVQFAPSGERTPLALLIQDPERLGMKRDALTFDPETGLAATTIRLTSPGCDTHEQMIGLSTRWSPDRDFPVVEATWETAGRGLAVRERFYCPDRSQPRLVREVHIKNLQTQPAPVVCETAAREATITRSIFLEAGEEQRFCLIYTFDKASNAVALNVTEQAPSAEESRCYWRGAATVAFGLPVLDRFFTASGRQLAAMVSCGGKVDASIWQYRREWVRDHAAMATGLVLSGHHRTAGVVLARLVDEFVTDEGDTIDSSKRRNADEVELDQNGTLLQAFETYANWTGDWDLIASRWSKITALAEYPLRGGRLDLEITRRGTGDALAVREASVPVLARQDGEIHLAYGTAGSTINVSLEAGPRNGSMGGPEPESSGSGPTKRSTR